MSTSSPSYDPVSGWVGWIFFAAVFMIVNGAFNAIQGIAALVKHEDFFVVTENHLLTLNYTSWGWIHIVFGVLLIVIGVFLFQGATWARVLAVIVVALNMISQFSFLQAYPVWAIVAIAIDAFILYALIVHGGELAEP